MKNYFKNQNYFMNLLPYLIYQFILSNLILSVLIDLNFIPSNNEYQHIYSSYILINFALFEILKQFSFLIHQYFS